MSNITIIPMEDNFSTKITQEYDGSSLGSLYVKETPSFTLPSGFSFYITISPNTSRQQVLLVDGFNSTTKTLNISDATVNKGPGLSYSANTHPVGSEVIISDPYVMWQELVDKINSKFDNDGGNGGTTFDLTLSGSNFRIRKDGSNMKFTDDSQAEVSLSTLAAAAGTDHKFLVSVDDTTPGYLDAKLTAGDGLTKTVVNDGANESIDLDIDLSDTTIFTSTQGNAGRVLKLDGSGNIDSSFEASTTRKGLVEMATDIEATTGTDETRYINPKQVKDNYGISEFLYGFSQLMGKSDALLSISTNTLTKQKEIQTNFLGSLGVKFDYTYSTGGGTSTVFTIFKNGSTTGQSVTLVLNGSSGTFTSNSISVSPGDLIQIYSSGSGSGYTAGLSNFRIYCDTLPVNKYTVTNL